MQPCSHAICLPASSASAALGEAQRAALSGVLKLAAAAEPQTVAHTAAAATLAPTEQCTACAGEAIRPRHPVPLPSLTRRRRGAVHSLGVVGRPRQRKDFRGVAAHHGGLELQQGGADLGGGSGKRGPQQCEHWAHCALAAKTRLHATTRSLQQPAARARVRSPGAGEAWLACVRYGVAPQPTGSSTQGLPSSTARLAASFMPPTHCMRRAGQDGQRAAACNMASGSEIRRCGCCSGAPCKRSALQQQLRPLAHVVAERAHIDEHRGSNAHKVFNLGDRVCLQMDVDVRGGMGLAGNERASGL